MSTTPGSVIASRQVRLARKKRQRDLTYADAYTEAVRDLHQVRERIAAIHQEMEHLERRRDQLHAVQRAMVALDASGSRPGPALLDPRTDVVQQAPGRTSTPATP
jgi:septal ring factor EnvC (AmiA/AmiB activator)